ncbi:Zinc finger mynd domain-containing protein 17 [Mycena venus]|uniref:Zinc finger mynd domain-containing protein 17 n=1 Tax=Mycena venus TaxID=2733690 RepID=A0A8H7CK76_9AGAR|nr:Zinc finger mynd domain-containing protein 17 [Mycena venus]
MLPPTNLTSALGLACHNCDKLEEVQPKGDRTPLLSGIVVAYTLTTIFPEDCQKQHWPRHKALCKVLRSLEKDTTVARDLIATFLEGPQSLETLNRISISHKSQMVDLCEAALARPLGDDEYQVLSYEPRCIACARTDIVLRMEASKQDGIFRSLRSCAQCKMAFHCCDSHWDAGRALHQAPSTDLPGGLSQCEMNIQVRLDGEFRNIMPASRLRHYMWQFMARQQSWALLKTLSWEDVIAGDVWKSVVGVAPKFKPACVGLVSSLATTMMTILYALEQLNANLKWTTESTLTIHILGSPPEFDPSMLYMYESILHRLPSVKILHIVFCSPAVAAMVRVPSMARSICREVDVCAECSSGGATIFHHYATKHYEDYVRTEGSLFKLPDLAIATNAFLATNDSARWRRTIKMLIERRIPTVFTAYDQRTAGRDLELIRDCGAPLVPSLTMTKNPWGSQVMHPNFDKVAIFDASFFEAHPAKTTYEIVAGILRLSTKYEVNHLRRRALVHLSSAFPMRLWDWDFRSGGNRKSWSLGDQPAARLVSVIQLCRETDALWILPSAFYQLGELVVDATDIIHGVESGASRLQLNPTDQIAFLDGYFLQRSSATGIVRFLYHPVNIEGCAHPARCAKIRMRALNRVLHDDYGDFPTSPLGIWERQHWERLPDICSICSRELRLLHRQARDELWQRLPEMYNLPCWEDLEASKGAALGLE